MKLRLVLSFCLVAAMPCCSQTKEHWVDLTWNASTSKTVTSYVIYRRGQSEKSWKKIGTTVETKFADHDVKAREKYVYKVCSVAKDLQGACTKEIKTKIPGK